MTEYSALRTVLLKNPSNSRTGHLVVKIVLAYSLAGIAGLPGRVFIERRRFFFLKSTHWQRHVPPIATPPLSRTNNHAEPEALQWQLEEVRHICQHKRIDKRACDRVGPVTERIQKRVGTNRAEFVLPSSPSGETRQAPLTAVSNTRARSESQRTWHCGQLRWCYPGTGR